MTETDLSEAVKNGYLLGCSDKIQDVAILLHKMVKKAFEKAEKLPWPPTASCLTAENSAPNNLQRFLRILISGKAERSESERIELLVLSIGQDLCRAATKGQSKLPKHFLVCMTLRHLFRSAKLSILMKKLGHSESYSYSLELETALAEAHTILTPQIIRNPHCQSLFHSDFDNFDQFVNDLSGAGSIHTCHGIMLQNIPCEPTNC